MATLSEKFLSAAQELRKTLDEYEQNHHHQVDKEWLVEVEKVIVDAYRVYAKLAKR